MPAMPLGEVMRTIGVRWIGDDDTHTVIDWDAWREARDCKLPLLPVKSPGKPGGSQSNCILPAAA